MLASGSPRRHDARRGGHPLSLTERQRAERLALLCVAVKRETQAGKSIRRAYRTVVKPPHRRRHPSLSLPNFYRIFRTWRHSKSVKSLERNWKTQKKFNDAQIQKVIAFCVEQGVSVNAGLARLRKIGPGFFPTVRTVYYRFPKAKKLNQIATLKAKITRLEKALQ